MTTNLHTIAATVLSLLITACSATREKPENIAERDYSVDFSGSWEMDFGRSDNLDDRLRSIYKELQRQAERQARNPGQDIGSRKSPFGNGSTASNSFANVIALARLADFITSSQILDIEQSAIDIQVEREDTFTLSCNFQDDKPLQIVNDELGNERCGWDGHQLLFAIALPDNIRIDHRMTLAQNRQKLHIASRVSRGARNAFTLNRVYYRFEPLPPDYACEYTLSRGNVCSRSSP